MRNNEFYVTPRKGDIYLWEDVNPILRDRELAIIETKRGCKYKIGDGKTPFRKLKYIRKIKSLCPYFTIYTPVRIVEVHLEGTIINNEEE